MGRSYTCSPTYHHRRPGTPDSELPIYTPPAAADYVLEVSAGFAARWGIQAGSRVMLRGVP